MDSELRKQQERDFHDHLREEAPLQRWSPETETDDPAWANFKYYSIERKSRQYVEDWIRERCKGRRVLDYCCGNGADAIFAAQNGAAMAVGIDLSEVSIENCQAQARSEGLEANTSFEVMDAEALTFEDNSFDLAVVYGVLHHLDFEKAMAQLARVVKPDGAIIATEALAHNPVIHHYRKSTPALRTPWEVEHILSRREIRRAKHYFDQVETRFYHLSTLAAVPFRKTWAFGPLLTLMEASDAALLSLPGLRWWAWQVVFTLTGPRKSLLATPRSTRNSGSAGA